MSPLSPFTAGDQPSVCLEFPTGIVEGVVVAIIFFCVILPTALALDASVPTLNLDGPVSVTIITSLSTMAICANKLNNPLSFRQLNVSHYYLC